MHALAVLRQDFHGEKGQASTIGSGTCRKWESIILRIGGHSMVEAQCVKAERLTDRCERALSAISETRYFMRGQRKAPHGRGESRKSAGINVGRSQSSLNENPVLLRRFPRQTPCLFDRKLIHFPVPSSLLMATGSQNPRGLGFN